MDLPSDLISLKDTVERSITNWERSLAYMQARMNAPGYNATELSKAWANTPLGPVDEQIPRVQSWLEKAREAVATGDKWAMRSAANTARNAWRPAASALQGGAQTLERIVPAARTMLPTLQNAAATAEANVPAIQAMVPAAESIVQPLVVAAEEAAAVVEENPLVVPLAVAAGRAAVVGGARGIFGGWAGIAIGATVAVAIAVGVYAWQHSGSGGSSQAVSAQAPPAPLREPEPVPAPEPPAPPPQNLLGPGEQPVVPAPTPNPEPPAQTPTPQQPQAPRPRSQTPTPAPQQQPAPAATPQCAYPNGINVSGGSTSSLGPQGGSFTVTSPNVVLSTGGLVNCGKHYQLAYSAGGSGATSSGYDCKTSGFSYNISKNVKAGDSVSVNFRLPPNSCG
jgi:hypothetical protein